MCLAFLHLPIKEFYDYTPIEINYALKAFYENKHNDIKLSWEQSRTSIYFAYLFVPSRKRKVSYSTFKQDFLPFSFDDENKEQVDVIDDEQFAAIQDYFKKKEEGLQ